MFKKDQPNHVKLRSILKERINPVVVWVGSGLSTAATLPSWTGLRKAVCDRFRDNLATQDPGRLRDEKEAEIADIEASVDLWVSFDRLSALGDATYTAAIRDALKEAVACDIPTNYRILMEIGFSGVITTNLDRLAGRAFASVYKGHDMAEFGAKDCAAMMHILRSPRPFILNAHGVLDNKSSWVFRQRDLKWLFQEAGYVKFIETCLCARTVVFVGMSVDDIATHSHLARLRAVGVDMGAHFWVTDRSDAKTDAWAEETGVALIRYSPIDDHAELGEMLADIKAYLPQDTKDVLPAFNEGDGGGTEPAVRPSEELLRTTSREDRRRILNDHAVYLLRADNKNRLAEYERFRTEYDACIYDCWYVSLSSPDNMLLGYRLIREIAEGAFGTVFEAEAPNGAQVALKLLKNDVRRKPEMLHSFRRGVAAMRILSENGVEGMVPYTDFSEIPAFVVMDYVDGPNIKQAVQSGYLNEWGEVLRFGAELTAIIRRAHQVSQHVFHRDIRPANIMLKGYETNPHACSVVVLDFDLSWYKDAEDVSISSGSTIHGYLAPEQIERVARVSTKSAAVDSFGLGMTLFFMRTGRDPIYMQHRHADWREVVTREVAAKACRAWRSLPSRYAELVLHATADSQAARCDVAYIEGELLRLKDAFANPFAVRDAELLGHELAFRCCDELGQGDCLRWSSEEISSSLSLRSGVTVTIRGQPDQRGVQIMFEWRNDGSVEFKTVGKYLRPHVEKALSLLGTVGAHVEKHAAINLKEANFSVVIPVQALAQDMTQVASRLAEAIQGFRF